MNFEQALSYFKDNLVGTNTLSSFLFKYIDSGHFYTFLPEKTPINDLHKFKMGGISKGPLIEKFHQFLLFFIHQTQNQLFLFDSCRVQPKPLSEDTLYLNYGRFIKDEIYFQVTGKKISAALLEQCYNRSYAIWHSLCILTQTQIPNPPNTEINEKELNELCRNIQKVFLLAYDGEGVVIWSNTKILIKKIVIEDGALVAKK